LPQRLLPQWLLPQRLLRYPTGVSQLAAFLNRTRTAVLLADDERHCVDANHGACRLLGVSRNYLLDRPIDEWLEADDREDTKAAWAELLKRGTLAGRMRLRVAAGDPAAIEFTATAHVAPGRHLVIISPPASAGASAPADDAHWTAMSGREREVMELVAAGATTDDVAARLFISPETVRRHVKNAMTKLGANTRAQAVAIALRRGELAA
jgi:PAS domain S-box-containing protein